MEKFTFAVPCLFGLEGLVGDELRRMGLADVKVEDRRAFFTGDFLDMARANLRLRMGERVMLLLGRFEARTFEELYQGVKALPLEAVIPRDGQFPVKGYSLSSQLHSVPDCQSIVKKAAVDRLGAQYGLTWLPETGAIYQIRFSLMKDVCEVFLDTSGLSLHKRGYRAVGNEAPLHETMAAAMVNLARYRGRDFFWDPFCGSGTIAIEAALAALNRAPGLGRSFGAERWPTVPKEIWQQARAEAKDLEYRGEYRILATDIDENSLEIARANAVKAGVSKYIDFRQGDATRLPLPCDKGTICCNPPYGERMLEQKSAQQLYHALGRHLRYADGWKKVIISSEPEFERCYGFKADKKRKLYNGRLLCYVYLYGEKVPR
ncbi:MAG TPA: class I SAM-dependent RNA methyltransferase [Candidatus Avoscillospira avicola]|uniref:Class I SAM-dependent RNA methyltransferase n=1 Tax=Candidatus Avoscillospira avicola TaxID=2840706 RepID=A0A9D1DFX1_9FIRM|nr:class I SAM-dependent RNA methyltransferase [Candidatus Avoscillospira avicola]